mgnify:CR=1 FL=1
MFAEAFSAAGLGGVIEMHSRKSQPQRDKASALFRAENRMIMFSSDVSARGVDYPGVTYVVQVRGHCGNPSRLHGLCFSVLQMLRHIALPQNESSRATRTYHAPLLSLFPVPQCGAPANREQYIHRAGRTGRAGRAGQCTLLLSDFERPFLNKLGDLPIKQLQPLALPLAAGGAALGPALVRDPAGALARAVAHADYQNRARAYQSFLGYYKSHEVIK